MTTLAPQRTAEAAADAYLPDRWIEQLDVDVLPSRWPAQRRDVSLSCMLVHRLQQPLRVPEASLQPAAPSGSRGAAGWRFRPGAREGLRQSAHALRGLPSIPPTFAVGHLIRSGRIRALARVPTMRRTRISSSRTRSTRPRTGRQSAAGRSATSRPSRTNVSAPRRRERRWLTILAARPRRAATLMDPDRAAVESDGEVITNAPSPTLSRTRGRQRPASSSRRTWAPCAAMSWSARQADALMAIHKASLVRSTGTTPKNR